MKVRSNKTARCKRKTLTRAAGQCHLQQVSSIIEGSRRTSCFISGAAELHALNLMTFKANIKVVLLSSACMRLQPACQTGTQAKYKSGSPRCFRIREI